MSTAQQSLVLESIQVGAPKPSPAGVNPTTGIDKQPIGEAVITESGVIGDTVADTKHHGGRDQAVYVYFRDDYDHWEDELGFALTGGRFGENLTISGVSSADLEVGDRITIRELTLEVTAPRIPCAVFSHHLDEANWVERFRDERRPGVYCRVVSSGAVAGSDAAVLTPGHSGISVLELQDLYYEHRASPERVQAALDAPVAERMRTLLEGRLSRV